LTIVPVPGVKPGAPYSICQFVEPPLVHERLIELVVDAVLVRKLGKGHVGPSIIERSSMAISPN
jgi:hypothetical protein